MISMRINVQNMQTQHQTVWLDSPLQSNPNILFPIHQLKVLIAPYIQGRPGGGVLKAWQDQCIPGVFVQTILMFGQDPFLWPTFLTSFLLCKLSI